MDDFTQLVFSLSTVGLVVIIGSLLSIARRDREQAGGRTRTGRTIAAPTETLSTTSGAPQRASERGPATA